MEGLDLFYRRGGNSPRSLSAVDVPMLREFIYELHSTKQTDPIKKNNDLAIFCARNLSAELLFYFSAALLLFFTFLQRNFAKCLSSHFEFFWPCNNEREKSMRTSSWTIFSVRVSPMLSQPYEGASKPTITLQSWSAFLRMQQSLPHLPGFFQGSENSRFRYILACRRFQILKDTDWS